MRVIQSGFLLFLAFSQSSVAAPMPSGDAQAIQALELRQEAAWNSHDAHAYSQLFTIDADTVNVLGWWWKSRDELDKKLEMGFKLVFAHSKLTIEEVAVRFLSADVAIAHVRWSMTGAASPDGSGGNIPQKGIQTQTLYKTAGGWLIAAFHNTNAVPERDFPMRAGAPGSS
jgi:uncharacterized protein (TIGR02246 family)